MYLESSHYTRTSWGGGFHSDWRTVLPVHPHFGEACYVLCPHGNKVPLCWGHWLSVRQYGYIQIIDWSVFTVWKPPTPNKSFQFYHTDVPLAIISCMTKNLDVLSGIPNLQESMKQFLGSFEEPEITPSLAILSTQESDADLDHTMCCNRGRGLGVNRCQAEGDLFPHGRSRQIGWQVSFAGVKVEHGVLKQNYFPHLCLEWTRMFGLLILDLRGHLVPFFCSSPMMPVQSWPPHKKWTLWFLLASNYFTNPKDSSLAWLL